MQRAMMIIYMAVRLCNAYVKKSAKELQYDYNRLC